MTDVLIFTAVGTSLLTNNKHSLSSIKKSGKFDYKKNLSNIESCLKNKRIENYFKTENNPFPAEISSLYAFTKSQQYVYEGLTDKNKKVILLHSPDLTTAKGINGKAVGESIKRVLKQPSRSKDLGATDRWDYRLEQLDGLDPKKASQFPGAINRLFDIVLSHIEDNPGAEVFLNITGGYKGLVPYLTMLGMALGKEVRIFYLFEESPEIIWLPTLPMAFDVLQWRDQRGLLQPFEPPLDKLLEPVQKQSLFKALQGTRIYTLLDTDDSGNVSLNAMGRFLSNLYDQDRERRLSRFGSGHLLLDLFSGKGTGLRNYIAERCIPNWIYMSAGDHIPETVEHGRGHVQRLLELAQQFILAARLKLSDEQLFVLISSIWLHDIGHTGDFFKFEGKDGLIQNKEKYESLDKRYCYGDPDMVRTNHSLLTYQLIKNDDSQPDVNKKIIFPEGFPTGYVRSQLIRSVQLACLFHRRKMPVQVKNGDSVKLEDFQVTKGVQDFKSPEIIEGFSLVAALLRICDGAENQAERSGGDEYEKVMRWVIKRRVSAMLEMDAFPQSLATLRIARPELFTVKKGMEKYVRSFDWNGSDIDFLDKAKKRIESVGKADPGCPSLKQLAAEAEFKARQPPHHKKHRMISQTFVVSLKEVVEEKNGKNGWFEGKNRTPLVGIYCAADTEYESYCRETVIEEIVMSLYGEFEPVAKLLPFSISIFLIEKTKIFQLVRDKTASTEKLVLEEIEKPDKQSENSDIK
jgi:CRISPR/Cas system-associated protein Csm6